MTQLDLLPIKPFHEIETANMRRYCFAPHGGKLRAQRQNIIDTTAHLKAEVDRQSVRGRSHRRVKNRAQMQTLLLQVTA